MAVFNTTPCTQGCYQQTRWNIHAQGENEGLAFERHCTGIQQCYFEGEQWEESDLETDPEVKWLSRVTFSLKFVVSCNSQKHEQKTATKEAKE